MPGRTILSLLLVIPCAATLAQDKADQQAAPSLNDMMSTAMQTTKPLPEHDRLRQLAGDWTYVVEMTMPGTPVMHGSGTTSIREILGGRFIEMRSNSDGQPPVSSLMIMGYDSRKGKEDYFALGVDTLGHYYVDPRGQWNQATASLELHGDQYDQASGATMPYRQVYRFPGKDTMTLDVFVQMPGSTEDIRMVGVVYQRHQGRQVVSPPSQTAARGQHAAGTGDHTSSAGAGGSQVPHYTGEQIEAMDRAELQSAIVEIMRARTMRGIQDASRSNLDEQYGMALDKLRSVRTAESAKSTTGSGVEKGGSHEGDLPSFGDAAISHMSMSEARAALTEISSARRIPSLNGQQRAELSEVFQKILTRISSLGSPEEAKKDEAIAEKEAAYNDPEGSEEAPTSDPPSETPSADPPAPDPSKDQG